MICRLPASVVGDRVSLSAGLDRRRRDSRVYLLSKTKWIIRLNKVTVWKSSCTDRTLRTPAATYLINHIRQIEQRDSRMSYGSWQHARALPRGLDCAASTRMVACHPPMTCRLMNLSCRPVVLLANDLLMWRTKARNVESLLVEKLSEAPYAAYFKLRKHCK